MSAVCLQMKVLEECSDVMGGVISPTEIQITGLAASNLLKSLVHWVGSLVHVVCTCWHGFQLCLLLLTSFIHLAGLGKF